MSTARPWLKPGLLLLALASCAPPLPTPETHIAVHAYLAGQSTPTAPPPAAWWQIFGNPQLDALEQTGLVANPSIGEAQANLQTAQFNAAAANGAFLPQAVLNAPGNSVVSRQSYPTGPNGYPPYTLYTLTGTLSYDPGLFGASKYTHENGQALADFQNAELEAARQNVAANIAAAAITEAGALAQIATTQNILAAEQNLLTLLHGEYADGAITQLGLLQQQSVIETTEATLPALQTQAGMQRDRLAILTGNLPADFDPPAITLDTLNPPAQIPVAVPTEYLANRPDIRAALAQVAAQNAALGIAVAHLYPDFSLSATGGYASETVGTLFNTDSALWILAGNLLAPIYEGGQLHDRKNAALAQLHAALCAYRGTVLTAFGQAADALQAERNDQLALARARDAAGTADAAYHLASAQFQLGAVDYTTVLAAQSAASQAALGVVQSRTALLLDIANLQAIMAR